MLAGARNNAARCAAWSLWAWAALACASCGDPHASAPDAARAPDAQGDAGAQAPSTSPHAPDAAPDAPDAAPDAPDAAPDAARAAPDASLGVEEEHAPSDALGGSGGAFAAPLTDARWPAQPASSEGALALGRELREQAQGPQLWAWMSARAVWPLGLNGVARVSGPDRLEEALRQHLPLLSAESKEQDTCEARTRAELLEGAPFHHLDRLGKRAPAGELARDLDRLGLGERGWWVNCHRAGASGYHLIVEPVAVVEGKPEARLRAVRY